jgi:hypothetical protein
LAPFLFDNFKTGKSRWDAGIKTEFNIFYKGIAICIKPFPGDVIIVMAIFNMAGKAI